MNFTRIEDLAAVARNSGRVFRRATATTLRHSRETTHLCSPKLTHSGRGPTGRFGWPRHAAFAADDNATQAGYRKQETYAPAARMMSPAPRHATWQNLFSAWATLNEQRWVISRERRGSDWQSCSIFGSPPGGEPDPAGHTSTGRVGGGHPLERVARVAR